MFEGASSGEGDGRGERQRKEEELVPNKKLGSVLREEEVGGYLDGLGIYDPR